MSEEVRNRGVLRVSLGLLECLLHLPEGHRIVATRPSDGFIDAVDVLVEGPTLPSVAIGQVTPRVQLIVTQVETDTMVRELEMEGKFL